MFEINIATIFPDIFENVFKYSIIKRAIDRNLIEINTYDIRDYTLNKHKKIDDYPYGGGPGMLMMADPIYRCYEDVLRKKKEIHTIYLTPKGKILKQKTLNEIVKKNKSIFVICGHYEGVDQRLIDLIVDEEISIGDYVLTGGEIAGLVLIDAIARLIPGVLKNTICFEEESHYNGLLEHPQYTKPREWRNLEVPEVLLSGNHEEIAKWKLEKSIEETKNKRPDMWEKYIEGQKND